MLVAILGLRTFESYTRAKLFVVGWSSPVARQPHKLEVVGSNPTPATKFNG